MSVSFGSLARQEIRWQGQETVRELNRQPHLLVRIDITGPQFPHRDAPAFMRIVNRRQAVTSWIADVSPDGRMLSGYFAVDDAEQGTIEYGFGRTIMGRADRPFDISEVKRLDRKRLPREVIVVSQEYLKGRR